MPLRLVALLLACWVTASWCELRDLELDRLEDMRAWQLGGERINYVLGTSSLEPSVEQPGAGAEVSLKLTCDFRDPMRGYVSAYSTGETIPGVCQELALWVFGSRSRSHLVLALEDARGRWFERDLGSLDWDGWRELHTPVGDGEAWQPLLRRGEERLPILHPVNLRQIAVRRASRDPFVETVYLRGLRARSDVAPVDHVQAEVSTERPVSLFQVGEKAVVQVTLRNAGTQPAGGDLTAWVAGFSGEPDRISMGLVALKPGETTRRELVYHTERLGPYEVRLVLRSDEREREWHGRFAVTRPVPPRRADPDALFGCCANYDGFDGADLPLVARLNRDAGIRWARIGLGWSEINPAPDRWTWDPLEHTEGPVGRAVVCRDQGLRVPHSPSLDCPDEVTIVFWARVAGSNGQWQVPLSKWGSANRRNYGVYFHRDNGEFCFSASYVGHPTLGWEDVSSGFSAWDGKWHHYAATYSRSAQRVALYVDGVLRREAHQDGGQLLTNREDLVVGRSLPAELDEMALFRRALTAEEVAALAARGNPPAEGLVAWWSFEGTNAVDGATQIADRSGNGLSLETVEPAAVRLARLARADGICTLGLLGFPPPWASTAPPEADRPWAYPPHLDAWGHFVENVARQYQDVVQHWELWNEPNITVFWLPQPDPKTYLELLKVGYQAAKRGNPDCTVLMPALAGPCEGRWGMDFLDELLRLGAARYCDAISIHPYRQATPEDSDLVGDLEHIARLAKEYGGRRPIWFTENGWTTQIPGGSTERRMAQMLPRAYALALGTGLVERLIWFRFHDPGTDRFYAEHNCGLCWPDLTPKPAYFAHRTLSLLLDGSRADGVWDVGPRALARCFRSQQERIAAVWCPEGSSTVAILVGEPTATVVDIMGNEQTLPTRDGVLVLNAGEDVTYLRGLGERARGAGALLSASGPDLVPGQEGVITVRVRNPFGEDMPARLCVSRAPDLTPGTIGSELTVPGRSVREITVRCAADEKAAPGWRILEVTAELAQRRVREPVQVAVRGALRDAGPVGLWHLDEGAGDRTGDSSGHENHGTVRDADWVPGKQGTGLRFAGGPPVEVPDASSLNLRDEVTLAFWIKPLQDTGTWQFPLGKYLGDQRRNYGIYLRPGGLAPAFTASFERGTFRHTDIPAAAPLDDWNWHHLAATYSMFDQRVRLYVDGKMVTDVPLSGGSMLPTTEPLRIGQDTAGIVDEVVIYPRALSPAEVAALAVG